ncbi:MAG: hypothetical protein J3K34DRAFT_401450 [Monoraphidium minutum]|nr:MAG: hypothetical protein J3K34DRAFT_401450 [Monoraphidium minutum]
MIVGHPCALCGRTSAFLLRPAARAAGCKSAARAVGPLYTRPPAARLNHAPPDAGAQPRNEKNDLAAGAAVAAGATYGWGAGIATCTGIALSLAPTRLSAGIAALTMLVSAEYVSGVSAPRSFMRLPRVSGAKPLIAGTSFSTAVTLRVASAGTSAATPLASSVLTAGSTAPSTAGSIFWTGTMTAAARGPRTLGSSWFM